MAIWRILTTRISFGVRATSSCVLMYVCHSWVGFVDLGMCVACGLSRCNRPSAPVPYDPVRYALT